MVLLKKRKKGKAVFFIAQMYYMIARRCTVFPVECELQEGRGFVLFPMVPLLPSTGRGMQ